jgi:hypothetical protein
MKQIAINQSKLSGSLSKQISRLAGSLSKTKSWQTAPKASTAIFYDWCGLGVRPRRHRKKQVYSKEEEPTPNAETI